MSNLLNQFSAGLLLKLKKFSSKVRSSLDVLIPYKTEKFIENYFRTIRLISVDGDREKIRQIYAIYGFHVLCLIYLSTNFLIPPDDHWSTLARFSYWRYFKLPLIDVLLIPPLLQAMYFYRDFYFKFYDNKLCNIIKAALFDNDLTFVLGSQKPYLRWTVWVLNAFQITIITIEIWAILTYWLFVSEMSRYPLWSLSGVFGLFSMTVNGAIAASCLFCYSYIAYLTVVIFTAYSLIYFERRNRMHRYLMKPISRFTPRRVLKFRVWHVDSIFHLHQEDQFSGGLFLAFLVANCPVNAYIVIMFIHLEVILQISLGVMAIGQMIGFFLIHLMLAKFAKKTHQSAHRLMELCVKMPNQTKIRDRVTMSFFAEMIHTRKKCGPHYGPFGLITMAAFVKYLLFYGEFVMSTFPHFAINRS